MIVEVPGPPVYSFDARLTPAASARPGDVVRFTTDHDAYRGLTEPAIDSRELRFHKVNALCGPLFVVGARPGDAIGFKIIDITLRTPTRAVYVSRWRRHAFGLAESRVVERQLDSDAVVLSSGGRIECWPMIGCIGVAPAQGNLSSLSPTAATGGNMDLVELQSGATIWLPVEAPGALLSMGDLHARMGRGEPAGAGLECAGQVEGWILLARGSAPRGPIVVDKDRIHFVGTSRESWRTAEDQAIKSAWDWLSLSGRVSEDDAIAICSALLDINAGGPAGNNVVASFRISELSRAEVPINVWPLDGTVDSDGARSDHLGPAQPRANSHQDVRGGRPWEPTD